MNNSPTTTELDRWTDEAIITSLLKRAHTIAVYGLSTDPSKDSHRVAAYLQRAGYTIIPIHPKAREILGVACHASLSSAPRADIVDCFRPSEELSGIVDAAIAAKAGAVWFQLGLMDADAARRAEGAGLTVIADRCAKVEHQRLIA
ncbi:MAG TPA: CoA-binding protein [Opitutaceae bacterium]